MKPGGRRTIMKLTRASSYALHAVAFMAQQKQHDKPMASHNIAAARTIPERFLLKVLKPLVSARVLLSIKGPNGGYRLAKPADKISMLEILEAVDGPIRGHGAVLRRGQRPAQPQAGIHLQEVRGRRSATSWRRSPSPTSPRARSKAAKLG